MDAKVKDSSYSRKEKKELAHELIFFVWIEQLETSESVNNLQQIILLLNSMIKNLKTGAKKYNCIYLQCKYNIDHDHEQKITEINQMKFLRLLMKEKLAF